MKKPNTNTHVIYFQASLRMVRGHLNQSKSLRGIESKIARVPERATQFHPLPEGEGDAKISRLNVNKKAQSVSGLGFVSLNLV